MTWQELETYIRYTAANVGKPTRVKLSGANFMTPDVVCVRDIGGVLVELSYGSAFMCDGWIIGVSVRPDNLDLSRCVHDPEELPAVLADIVEALSGVLSL